jgi:hypothetical protein
VLPVLAACWVSSNLSNLPETSDLSSAFSADTWLASSASIFGIFATITKFLDLHSSKNIKPIYRELSHDQHSDICMYVYIYICILYCRINCKQRQVACSESASTGSFSSSPLSLSGLSLSIFDFGKTSLSQHHISENDNNRND